MIKASVGSVDFEHFKLTSLYNHKKQYFIPITRQEKLYSKSSVDGSKLFIGYGAYSPCHSEARMIYDGSKFLFNDGFNNIFTYPYDPLI